MAAVTAPVLIAAGGTGGHVVPALEVARVLRERGAPVLWLGTRRGLEARLVPAQGIDIHWLDVQGLRGKGFIALALAPLKLLRACWQALFIIRRQRPRVVLGMGGFVTGPVGLMAALSGYPLVIHEQNAVAGLTNRLLKPFAKRVLQAVDSAFASTAMTVGNPVRRDILSIGDPAQRLGNHIGALRVLVVGGSQGAVVLNQVVPEAIRISPVPVEVIHQCGRGRAGDTELRYRRCAYREFIKIQEFIDDMPGVLEWADIVICRSGAMTVSELMAAGSASILVPFPHAVDDHQTLNAQTLSAVDAGILCPQSEFNEVWLSDQLTNLSRSRLLEMSKNARRMARSDSAQRIADIILKVAQ